MWGVQLLLVNAYVLYKTFHLLIWKTAKIKLLSQFEFQKAIVLEWFGLEMEDSTSAMMSENRKKRKSDLSNMQHSLSSEELNSSKQVTQSLPSCVFMR